MRTFCLLVLLALPTAANASGGWDITGTYLAAGLNLGYGLTEESLQLGGEVSLVDLTDELAWYGVFADGGYAFGPESTRMALGVEGGLLLGGVDLALVYDTASGDFGTRMRLLFSFFVQSAYVGTQWFPDTGSSWEVGVLIKAPVPLDMN